jgi:hypothetical protein
MKKVIAIVLFTFFISIITISCTDKKKEEEKTKAAVEKIEAAEKEVETISNEIEEKATIVEKEINELDNL